MADAALFAAFVPFLLDIPVAASSTSECVGGELCVSAQISAWWVETAYCDSIQKKMNQAVAP